MNLAEYYEVKELLDAELQTLSSWCADHGRTGPAVEPQDGDASDGSGAP